MSLVSLAFLFGFLPIVAIGTHVLRDHISVRAAQLWVLGASLAFYAASGARYLPLLLLSAAFNWGVSRAFSIQGLSSRGRKGLLIFGLSSNVLLLCVVKYARFFLDAIAPVVGEIAWHPQWGFPLGISFFTIAQVMYLVDCYERLIPTNTAFNHLTFVSFFPNVTAGPLERVKHFVTQLGDLGSPHNRDERIARAIMLLAIGLFKKVVLSDSFARIANAGYEHVNTLSTAGAWLTSLAYTFQLYFDFSGYSDIAFGAARLLGITLVFNFNAPFRAKTMSEYWQRWHISLSTFITTYLYTPIARSMGRLDVHKATLASLVSMTIAGFWHGPSWTFVVWGILQGIGIGVYQYWKRVKRPLPDLLATVVTFAFVNLTMIVFRSPTVGTALTVSRRLLPSETMLGISEITGAIPSGVMPMIALPIVFGSIVAFAGPTSNEITSTFRPSTRAAVAVVAILCISLMFLLTGGGSDFAYRVF